MFEVKVVAKQTKVTISDENGRAIYKLKSGSSVTVPDDIMNTCAGCIQGLLGHKPSVITVNKIDSNKKNKVASNRPVAGVKPVEKKVEEKKSTTPTRSSRISRKRAGR